MPTIYAIGLKQWTQFRVASKPPRLITTESVRKVEEVTRSYEYPIEGGTRVARVVEKKNLVDMPIKVSYYSGGRIIGHLSCKNYGRPVLEGQCAELNKQSAAGVIKLLKDTGGYLYKNRS